MNGSPSGRLGESEVRSELLGVVAPGPAVNRPTYPAALYEWLAEQVPTRALAWDAGCGAGLGSLALAEYFERVVGTDLNAQQLAVATRHPRVEYRVGRAELSGLPDKSVSLVTVAQALHWFEVDAFHAEVQRVLVPDGVIAEWSYSLLYTPANMRVGSLVNDLDRLVHPWWPAERRHVDDQYATLDFPFGSLDAPWFRMTADWTKGQLLGYLGTWSAISRYRALSGDDPLVAFSEALNDAWGGVDTLRFEWPLALRVGYALR